MSALPFKPNRDRRHRIPRQKHKVTNWPAYEAGLRQRGSLTVWFTEEAVEAWAAEPRTTRGVSGCGTLLGSGALGDRGVRLALRRPRAGAPGGRNGLMLSIHPNARTTPAVRAEIARSAEPTGELARRYGVSTETIRKGRKRGPADCQDRSARPHKLPWKASEEERAIVCALRRATGFPLDDLTFILTHVLPHLNRDAVYRILKAEGITRLTPAERTPKPHSAFKAYEVGVVHMDVKPLPT